MKTTKFNLKAAALTVFAAFAIFFSACGDNLLSPGSDSNNINPETGNLSPNISVQVVRGSHDGFYFHITNNTSDTIVNDFHIQMVDETAKIIGLSTWPSNWVIDPTSIDKNKGKVGIKTGQNGQAIQPGQTERPLWIDVKFGRSGNRAFNWQATRDGVVVASGRSVLPN